AARRSPADRSRPAPDHGAGLLLGPRSTRWGAASRCGTPQPRSLPRELAPPDPALRTMVHLCVGEFSVRVVTAARSVQQDVRHAHPAPGVPAMNRPVLRLLAPLAISGVLVAGTASPASAATSFTDAIFEATHNSYSGNLDAQRGSIVYQLDHGVRFIELDIHDNDYATVGDYEIGHSSPRDLVDH